VSAGPAQRRASHLTDRTHRRHHRSNSGLAFRPPNAEASITAIRQLRFQSDARETVLRGGHGLDRRGQGDVGPKGEVRAHRATIGVAARLERGVTVAAERVVTTTTIAHQSNAIDVSEPIVASVAAMFGGFAAASRC
jgi:hypothetical protein